MATVEESRVDFPVKGMHCAACVGKVERALQGVPGVDRAAVNLATERATVWLDPAQAGLPALRTAVAAAGYTVPEEIAATPEAADRERAERAQEDRRAPPAPPRRRRALGAGAARQHARRYFPGPPSSCGIPGCCSR